MTVVADASCAIGKVLWYALLDKGMLVTGIDARSAGDANGDRDVQGKFQEDIVVLVAKLDQGAGGSSVSM
ncbi:hypothetical protein [Ktedonobacter robiniae]|uniref:Uncharacterized protein n=1 Tax=Ktedonobacter robiniae TaxID=2778365 RepID=A0ABQ3V3K3_9CHLR|nr:hypothetical protein [Ktedonobacter robiniae]GHO59573.1 hypothetical protein KSB_80480 [Ktedonobacter robiniae]